MRLSVPNVLELTLKKFQDQDLALEEPPTTPPQELPRRKSFDRVDDDGNTIALSEDTPVEGSVDEWAHATPEEAIEFAGKAARLEGMMVGPSAGAALSVESGAHGAAPAAGSHVRGGASAPARRSVTAELARALPRAVLAEARLRAAEKATRRIRRLAVFRAECSPPSGSRAGD